MLDVLAHHAHCDCCNHKKVLPATMSFFLFVLNGIETFVEYFPRVGIERHPLG
jgi:hypothetical protein